MSKEYETILFTSNLTKDSSIAFKQAALLSYKFNAKIIILHVMKDNSGSYDGYIADGISGSYEGCVINLFGEDRWHQILKDNKEVAKHALIGKVSPRQMVQTALKQICKDENEDKKSYGTLNYEIVVKEGQVVDKILSQVEESNCDLIIMGAGAGLFYGRSVSNNIKKVLKKSNIPVLIVPTNIV